MLLNYFHIQQSCRLNHTNYVTYSVCFFFHFVGEEVKSIFMASGLPQQVLAHIWLEILLHDATYHPLHNQFIYLHECYVILS